jgi:hypothetical protein
MKQDITDRLNPRVMNSHLIRIALQINNDPAANGVIKNPKLT